MPVFTQSLQKIDETTPQEAIKKMANHIRYIQEQLEYTLHNLDSKNINEIDTDKTQIGSSSNNSSIGSYIYITGPEGESFTVGKTKNGKFEFTVKGADGKQLMYLDSTGAFNITESANVTIDGGEW